MSILGTWILRTWLYANYVFSLSHPLQEVDFQKKKKIMGSHDMTCISKFGENNMRLAPKIRHILHLQNHIIHHAGWISLFVLDAWSYFYPKLYKCAFYITMNIHVSSQKINNFSSSWSNPFHFWITHSHIAVSNYEYLATMQTYIKSLHKKRTYHSSSTLFCKGVPVISSLFLVLNSWERTNTVLSFCGNYPIHRLLWLVQENVRTKRAIYSDASEFFKRWASSTIR